MVFAVSVPFIAALGAVKNAGISFYAGSVILIVPFLASAGFAGSSFAVIVMKFFPAAKIRNIIFITGALFFTALLVIVRLVQPEKFVSSEGFEQLSQYLGYLDAPTAKFLPSWWYCSALMSLIAGNLYKTLFYSLLLAASAAAAFYILKFLGGRYFIDGLNEGQAFARVKNKRENYKKRNPLFTLLHKDLKVFFRDSGQWSQVLILASIVLVYLFSMYKLSFETLKMHNTMAVVNCALVWFVATAAALRLSFPLISLEGESFWFLLSSPVSRLKLYIEKIIFGSVPVFLTSAVLISATNYMMSVSAPVFALTLISTVFVSLVISCAAVSAGTILPKFNYSNIAQIESSLGGLVFMLFSFFAIIANIIIIMQPVRIFYSGQNFQNAFAGYAIFIALFNLLIAAFSFFAGYNALKRLEK
jgi:ABC-2 type transport system permease protein